MIAPYSDLPLGPDGDLLPYALGYVDGTDLVLQRIPVLIRLHLGEFFLDLTQGFDYAAWAQQKPLNTVAIETIIRAAVQQVPGGSSVTGLTVTVASRTMTVEMTLLLDSGESATGSGTVAGVGPTGVPWTWTVARGRGRFVS